MALPKGALIAGGVAAVIVVILVMNTSGGRGQKSTMSWSPLPAAPPTSDILIEMKALQQRVAELEQRLGAKYERSDRRAERLIVAETARARVSEEARRTAGADSAPDLGTVVVSSTPAAGPTVVASSRSQDASPSSANGGFAHVRPMLPAAKGVVPNASWWSELQVELPGGLWCPQPPPFSAVKPPLPMVAPVSDKPKLTRELAKKHASADNMVNATDRGAPGPPHAYSNDSCLPFASHTPRRITQPRPSLTQTRPLTSTRPLNLS